MLPAGRLLIIEREALVAVSMQWMLEGTLVSETEILRDFNELQGLEGRLASFRLAVVNHPGAGDAAAVQRLVEAIPAIVVCTGDIDALREGPLAGAVKVPKPFSEEALLAACRMALGED